MRIYSQEAKISSNLFLSARNSSDIRAMLRMMVLHCYKKRWNFLHSEAEVVMLF
jgi:hypothetical protein